MKVLVLGASGMLGNAVFRVLSERDDWQVYGSIRSENSKCFFTPDLAERLVTGVDVEQQDSLVKTFSDIRPNVVINCIGLVKQLDHADDPLQVIPINTLLPHRLANLCTLAGARLVHMSTDCVFSGTKGQYSEADISDATDLYGKSKYLGEVDYPNAITLRTSIIGHELSGAHGLIDWFLSQQGTCKGYTRAIFSGVPTVILAKIIRDIVIPHTELHGVYQVAAHPISKHALLDLVARIYDKKIDIVPDDRLVIDRSLDTSRFKAATGYVAPEWQEMIELMKTYR